MAKAVLGIIGGSGIYDLPGLQNVREERVALHLAEADAARALAPAARREAAAELVRADRPAVGVDGGSAGYGPGGWWRWRWRSGRARQRGGR